MGYWLHIFAQQSYPEFPNRVFPNPFILLNRFLNEFILRMYLSNLSIVRDFLDEDVAYVLRSTISVIHYLSERIRNRYTITFEIMKRMGFH